MLSSNPFTIGSGNGLFSHITKPLKLNQCWFVLSQAVWQFTRNANTIQKKCLWKNLLKSQPRYHTYQGQWVKGFDLQGLCICICWKLEIAWGVQVGKYWWLLTPDWQNIVQVQLGPGNTRFSLDHSFITKMSLFVNVGCFKSLNIP